MMKQLYNTLIKPNKPSLTLPSRYLPNILKLKSLSNIISLDLLCSVTKGGKLR